MNEFFVSLILIGTVILISALIMILYDWKKYNDGTEIFSEKINKLQKMLEDADLMIDEMNGISNYIVENIEKKTEEMNMLFNQINNTVGELGKVEINNEPEELSPSEILYEAVVEEGRYTPFNSRQKEIIELCKEGLNATDIAKKLNIGKGEVQFIMGINK